MDILSRNCGTVNEPIASKWNLTSWKQGNVAPCLRVVIPRERGPVVTWNAVQRRGLTPCCALHTDQSKGTTRVEDADPVQAADSGPDPVRPSTPFRPGLEQNSRTGGLAGASSGGYSDSDEDVTSLMEGITFAQLCDEFQCVSSPAVERTARLLARDIHDIKEDRRNLSCFAVDVVYRDPLRRCKGRGMYRRPSWILTALEEPHVSMLGMEMASTSLLIVRWRLRGSFRSLPGASALGAALDLLVTSSFSLNQISGQVVEHTDQWDLSRCSPAGALLFYPSRAAWSVVQLAKDAREGAAALGEIVSNARGRQDNNIIFRDPSGDPRKFFIQEDPNRDLYQFALAVALLYLLVRFLQQVL